MPAARSFALTAVAVLSALSFAGARGSATPTCTITWDGSAGTTAWATATNWDLDRLPGANDHVCIPVVPAAVVYSTGTTSILSLQALGAVSLTGGMLNLTDTGNASNVATFSQTGGALAGAAALNIGGVYTWTGGSMDGSGTTNVIAGATLAQDGFTTLTNGRVLENAGTYDFKLDRSVGAGGVPAPSIHNTGTIVKSGGSLAATINVALDNDGSVRSTSGTLELRAGTGTGTGSFGGAGAAGTVKLAAGTYPLAGASLLGNAAIAGGTVTVPAGAGVIAAGPNAMSAGTVNGTGAFTIASGTFTWTGGTMTDAGTTTVAAGATVAQDGFTSLSGGRVVENAGTLDFKSDRALDALGSTTLHNTGTIRKSGGSLTATINAALDNDGSVQSSSGTLDLRAGTGTATGSFGGAGATGMVRLAAGTQTLAGATLLGNVAFAGATVNVAAGSSVTASGPNAMSAGSVNGTGAFTIAGGTFTWTGGTMADAGTTTVAPGATLAQDGFTSLSSGRVLENAGTLEFESDRSLDPLGSPAPSLHNTGTIRKAGGTITSTINVALDNDGSVRSDVGKLSLRAGTGTSTGSFGAPAAAGTVELGGGTHTLAGASLLGIVTIAGGTVNVPAGASLSASGANAMSGGTLGGTGGFTIGSGSFTWTGGTMTDAGTTTVAAGATLAQDGSTNLVAGRLLENAGTYDFKSDRTVADSSAAAPSIHNTGTIRKTGGTGEAIINPAVANDGTITSTSGKLTLRKGADATQPGTFAGISDLDHVVLGGGTFRLTAATTFQGTVEIGGASVQVVSGAALAVPGRLLFTSGELRGPGTVDVIGTLAWKGGSQFGPGTTLVRASARMEVDAQFCTVNLRDGRRVQNNGSLALLRHTSINGAGAPKSVIDNAGRIDLDDAAGTACGLVPSTLGGTLLVNNAAGATISKLGSTAAATADTRIDGLVNDGLVEAQAGALSLTSTSAVTQGGTFSSTGAGSSVAFTGGTFLLGPGARLAGQSKVTGAEIDIADQASLRVAPGDTLSVIGGTLAGAGTLVVGGTFAWMGGSQQGGGATVVADGATATFDGRMLLEGGRTFVNHGAIVWQSGDFFVGEGASFVNAGTLELEGTSRFVGETFGPGSGALFHNAGLLEKTAATTSTLEIPVDNDGTIEVDGGRLNVQGTLLNYGGPGKTLTAGGYVVRDATLRLPGSVASNASTLVLDGAGAKLVFVDPFDPATDHDAFDALAANAGAGELTLDNGRAVATPGPLRNAGILTLGASSALTTAGVYRQTGGITTLGAAGSRLTATGATVQVMGGRFGGIGSAGPELAASGGEVEPGLGDVGILHADAYSAGPSSTLRMQLAGVTPGTGHDRLAVAGATALGGTLAIETAPDFHPALGSTFQILTFASRTGTFSSVTGVALGGGLAYDVVYNATNVTLVVATAAPGPAPADPPIDELVGPPVPVAAPPASDAATNVGAATTVGVAGSWKAVTVPAASASTLRCVRARRPDASRRSYLQVTARRRRRPGSPAGCSPNECPRRGCRSSSGTGSR